MLLTIPVTLLGYDYDIQIEPWDKKLQGYRITDEKRSPLEGGLGFGGHFLRQYDQDGWFESIPKKLLEASNSFPEYQYQMLWLAANSLLARQLLEAKPIILALICDKYRFDNEKAIKLCQFRHKQILSHLGLDGSNAALQFIDKLVLDFTRGDEIQHLKRMLNKIDKRYLGLKNYPTIDHNALLIDLLFPKLSGSRLGRAIITQVEPIPKVY